MSPRGTVRIGDTRLDWNETRGEIHIVPAALPPVKDLFMSYDQARELLDCLMVVFGRMELAYRYPEVR